MAHGGKATGFKPDWVLRMRHLDNTEPKGFYPIKEDGFSNEGVSEGREALQRHGSRGRGLRLRLPTKSPRPGPSVGIARDLPQRAFPPEPIPLPQTIETQSSAALKERILKLQSSLNTVGVGEPVYARLARETEDKKLSYQRKLDSFPDALHNAAHSIALGSIQTRLAHLATAYKLLRSLDDEDRLRCERAEERIQRMLLGTVSRLEDQLNATNRYVLVGPEDTEKARMASQLSKANNRIAYLEEKLDAMESRVVELKDDVNKANKIAHQAAKAGLTIACPNPATVADTNSMLQAQQLHHERIHLAEYIQSILDWGKDNFSAWNKVRSVAVSVGMDVPPAPPKAPYAMRQADRTLPLASAGKQEGRCGCSELAHRFLFPIQHNGPLDLPN